MKKTLLIILGVLLILAGIALGLYLGVAVLFVGGIVEIVHGAQASPVDAGAIAWGAVKAFVLAELIGYVAVIIVSGAGFALVGAA